MNITLAKALKIKNRLAGELAKLQAIIRTHNAVRSDRIEERSIDIDEIWKQIKSVRNNLVSIRSKIAEATSSIAPKLIQMEEYKSYITFLNTLPIRETTETEVIGYGAAALTKEYKWESFISEAEKNLLINEAQKSIDLLQDEVDEYNAITKISIDF